MSVSSREWLDLLRREYLDDFVRLGGAAVKFAITPEPAEGASVLARVEAEAEEAGYLVARIDAARVRVHMMQDVFFEVARRVPWRDLARRAVRGHYVDSGLSVPGDDLSADAVAAANAIEAHVLQAELRQRGAELLRRADELSKDFRLAMLWLCYGEVWPGRLPAGAVTEWLRGELRLISALRDSLIFRKIGRHNARAMLGSLSAWCRIVGLSGLVLTLDVRRLGVARRADVGDDGLFYSKAAVLDAYEVLRQLIDATDDLRSMLCVVVADPALFDDERRGVTTYKALYERVWPDVQLRQRANPLSALARLGAVAGA